jgi:hypothetical protein
VNEALFEFSRKGVVMKYRTFTLSSREEVAQFEAFFDRYMTTRAAFPLKHISLLKAFEQLQRREEGNRIFAALLDVQINFLMLWLDSNSVGAAWSAFVPSKGLTGGSILDSLPKFIGKMDIHRYNSSFVLRYRALWDKIMGLLILLVAATEYDRFYSASSRKKEFGKIVAKFWDNASITNLAAYLSKFDDSFRTAEAHGTGVLRKYTFTMETLEKNPQIELLDYWNVVNGFVCEIGNMLALETDASGQCSGISSLHFDSEKWLIRRPSTTAAPQT